MRGTVIVAIAAGALALGACSSGKKSESCATACGAGLVCDPRTSRCVSPRVEAGSYDGLLARDGSRGGDGPASGDGPSGGDGPFDGDGPFGGDGPSGGDGPPRADGPPWLDGATVDAPAQDSSTVDSTTGVCSSTDVSKSCGDVNQYCDFGTCTPCPSGTTNCNGVDACECTGTCSGSTCQGTTACDYSDSDACGKNTSMWCYLNKCIQCTSGFFNCNNTKGCECDSAGCNGTQCAGTCSGGECP